MQTIEHDHDSLQGNRIQIKDYLTIGILLFLKLSYVIRAPFTRNRLCNRCLQDLWKLHVCLVNCKLPLNRKFGKYLPTVTYLYQPIIYIYIFNSDILVLSLTQRYCIWFTNWDNIMYIIIIILLLRMSYLLEVIIGILLIFD